jgi:hypothetical protein
MKPTLVAAAALLLMFDVPGTARAGDHPFRGSGVATVEGNPFDGTSYEFNGTATHLGAFTGDGYVQFFSLADWTLVSQGSTTFVAANGDELYASFLAFKPPWAEDFVGQFSFLGGTGRFADAGGSAVIVATPLDATSFLIQFDGTIDD